MDTQSSNKNNRRDFVRGAGLGLVSAISVGSTLRAFADGAHQQVLPPPANSANSGSAELLAANIGVRPDYYLQRLVGNANGKPMASTGVRMRIPFIGANDQETSIVVAQLPGTSNTYDIFGWTQDRPNRPFVLDTILEVKYKVIYGADGGPVYDANDDTLLWTPQVMLERDSDHSHMSGQKTAVGTMEFFFRKNSHITVNNLVDGSSDVHEFAYNSAFGVNLNPVGVPVYAPGEWARMSPLLSDIEIFKAGIRCKAGRHTVMSLQQLGCTGDDIIYRTVGGHRIYELVAHRIEGETSDADARVALIARVDCNTGKAERVAQDPRYVDLWGTDKPAFKDMAYYAEIFTGIRDSAGNYSWDRKRIDTMNNAVADFPMNDLKDLTRTKYWE